MDIIKTMKFTLDTLIYVLFTIAVCSLAYSIYTKDFMTMIPAGFGVFTFGGCIQISRMMQRRIREIEND